MLECPGRFLSTNELTILERCRNLGALSDEFSNYIDCMLPASQFWAIPRKSHYKDSKNSDGLLR